MPYQLIRRVEFKDIRKAQSIQPATRVLHIYLSLLRRMVRYRIVPSSLKKFRHCFCSLAVFVVALRRVNLVKLAFSACDTVVTKNPTS